MADSHDRTFDEPVPTSADGTSATDQTKGTLVVEETDVTKQVQGAVASATFPGAIEYLATERPRGLGSDANLQTLLIWSRELYNRAEASDQERRELAADLTTSQANYHEEREKRITIEQALRAHDAYRPFREIVQGAGIALVGIALGVYDQSALAIALAVVGVLLWSVAFFGGSSLSKP